MYVVRIGGKSREEIRNKKFNDGKKKHKEARKEQEGNKLNKFNRLRLENVSCEDNY